MKSLFYFPIIILLICFQSQFSQGQNLSDQEADSLLQLYVQQTGDERIQILRQFMDGVNLMPPDRILIHAKTALELGEGNNDPNLIYAAMGNYGTAYIKMGQVVKFLEWNLKIKEMIEGIEGFSTDTLTIWTARMVSTLNQIGTGYAGMGNLHLALDYFLQSHRLMEKTNYTRYIHISHFSLGKLYGEMKQYDDALFHLRKALAISWEKGDSLWVSTINGFMGWVYGYEQQYDSALICYNEALRIGTATGYKDLIANNLHDIGKIYGVMDSNTKAIKYIEEAYTVRNSIDFNKDRVSLYYNEAELVGWDADRGAILQALGRNEEAMVYLNRALENLPYAQDLSYSDNVYRALYLAHKGMGNFKEALEYHEKMEEIKDSIFSKDKQNEILRLKAVYEDEKKQQSINLLEKENQINGLKLVKSRYIIAGISGLIVVLVLLAFMTYRQIKINTSRKQIQLEQRLLRAQMNPHFIFNALSSIQGFIVEKDHINASIYLSRFSKLIKNILDNSAQEYVPLAKEINTIENYLALQKIRYEDKFDFNIEIDEKIDPETIFIPPMLAQPFIENSIEHGIKHKKTNGHIDIRFTLKDQVIVFEVEDDGVGRAAAREIEIYQQKDHRSMATAITHERLSILNKKNRGKIHLQIIDLLTEGGLPSGTKVKLEIPVLFI
jgi:tetratricopeptide (TPR) repeat protein